MTSSILRESTEQSAVCCMLLIRIFSFYLALLFPVSFHLCRVCCSSQKTTHCASGDIGGWIYGKNPDPRNVAVFLWTYAFSDLLFQVVLVLLLYVLVHSSFVLFSFSFLSLFRPSSHSSTSHSCSSFHSSCSRSSFSCSVFLPPSRLLLSIFCRLPSRYLGILIIVPFHAFIALDPIVALVLSAFPTPSLFIVSVCRYVSLS